MLPVDLVKHAHSHAHAKRKSDGQIPAQADDERKKHEAQKIHHSGKFTSSNPKEQLIPVVAMPYPFVEATHAKKTKIITYKKTFPKGKKCQIRAILTNKHK